MPKLDDTAYQEGRQAFARGVTIRQIVEQIDGDADELKSISSAVGFADAMLDMLRAASIVFKQA